MSRSPDARGTANIDPAKVQLFIWATYGLGTVSMIALGMLLWSLVPASWRAYFDPWGDTASLLVLFLGLPVALVLLWLAGFVAGAYAVHSLVSREEAERALLVGDDSGRLGAFERRLLGLFKSDATSER